MTKTLYSFVIHFVFPPAYTATTLLYVNVMHVNCKGLQKSCVKLCEFLQSISADQLKPAASEACDRRF